MSNVKQEIDPGRNTVPIIKGGRTLVPIRAIVEALDGTLAWDEKNQGLFIKTNSTKIRLNINDRIAYVNNQKFFLEVSPEIIHGRTFVPLRFVAESLDCKVVWDEKNNSITISSEN